MCGGECSTEEAPEPGCSFSWSPSSRPCSPFPRPHTRGLSIPCSPASLGVSRGSGALCADGRRTRLTLSFPDQDGGLVEEPTTSPFLPSPSLKLPLSNSALPSQALGGMASGLGMQNLNSSRQVRLSLGAGRAFTRLRKSVFETETFFFVVNAYI